MSLSDWVGVAEAVVLAVAAYFSARAYSLSRTEHREARAEEARVPRRQLLLDAIEELKALALASVESPYSEPRADAIRAHQARFQVAIAFVNAWAELRDSSELAVTPSPNVTLQLVLDAVGELNWNLRALEAGWFDRERAVSYRVGESGDLPPIIPPQVTAAIGRRWPSLPRRASRRRSTARSD